MQIEDKSLGSRETLEILPLPAFLFNKVSAEFEYFNSKCNILSTECKNLLKKFILERMEESSKEFETECGQKIYKVTLSECSHTNKIISGILTDITTETQEIKRLRKIRKDWHRAFDSIEEVIIILDSEMRVKHLNKAALEEYDEFIDNPEGLFCNNLYHIGESHCATCPARKTFFDRKPHTCEVHYESLDKTFLTSSSPILNENGKLEGIVFTAKNITKEIKLKQEAEFRFRQMLQADKLKSLGELVANVAHEINNPNSFILQNSSLLEKSWKLFKPIISEYAESLETEYDRDYYLDLSEETDELINSVQLGSKRISNVVTKLKGFARTDEDDFRDISINDVIDSSMMIVASKVKKSFSNIEINYSENIPDVYGDSKKLEQVFVNIIVNASQAINNKSNSLLRIETKYIERLNSILIRFYDNGKGFTKESKRRLFQPFFTTRSDSGGSGLGLSISKEIIEKHNGIIKANSVPLIGTTFNIFLPVSNSKIGNQGQPILYLDSKNLIQNNELICLLGEGSSMLSRVENIWEAKDYLNKYPETEIFIANFDIVDFESEILELRNEFLYQTFILFDETNILEDVRFENGIYYIRGTSHKSIITEINKIIGE